MATYATPKEALEACLQIWQCIYDNRFNSKQQAYEHLSIPQTRDLHSCPACEFTKEEGADVIGGVPWQDCTKCLLWKGESPHEFTCTAMGTPFMVWGSTGGGLPGARMMVELIESKLKDLK